MDVRFNPRAQVCEASRCEDSQTGFLSFAPSANVFYHIEWVSVVIFTLEYCVRVFTCPAHRRLAFVITATNLIDLIAWLPFWFIGAAQVLATAAVVVVQVGYVRHVGEWVRQR